MGKSYFNYKYIEKNGENVVIKGTDIKVETILSFKSVDDFIEKYPYLTREEARECLKYLVDEMIRSIDKLLLKTERGRDK